MRSGAIVPAGWAAFNGALLAILAGFGGSANPLWLYGASVALTEFFAGAVLLSEWRHPAGRTYQVPARGETALLAGVGLSLVALGVTFGAWFFPMAAVSLWLSLRFELKDRRRQLSH